jgi:PAS domain S-box-containing protein
MIFTPQNRSLPYKVLSTLKIVAIYALLSGLWIYFSDTILGSIVSDPTLITQISIVKGWLFIIVTGAILFYLIGRFAAEIQKTQKELAVSEGYYRGIFDFADDAIYIVDPAKLKILNCNDKACSMLGFGISELTSMTVIDLHPPEERSLLAGKIKEIDGKTSSASISGLHHAAKDGSLVPVEVSISFIKIGDEEVYLCISRDVTTRTQALEEARKSYALLNALINGTSDVIYVKDLLGRYLLFNPAAERITGKSSAEVLGKDDSFLFGPAEAAAVMDDDRKVMAAGEVTTYEDVLTTATGETVTFLSTKGPVFDAEGKPYGLFGISRDITERKSMEQSLRKSETFLKQAQVIAGIGSYVLDIPTGCWTSSEVLDDILGIDKTFIRSVEGWALLIHPDCRENMNHYFINEVFGKHERFGKEYKIIRKTDGAVRWLHGEGELQFDDQLRPVKMIGTIMDITDRKQGEEERARMEEQMQQTQKLESLGVLAGGIAHDFNNLLMSILGHSSLAQTKLTPASPARDDLQQIETAALRAADLCSQMLAYAGKGKFSLEVIDLRSMIEDMARLLKVSITKKSILNLDLQKDLPPIEADPAQIRQVVMNLIINASEAIGEQSGVITVSTGVMKCDPDNPCEAYIGSDVPNGTFVYLEVSDTGCGMDRETQQRIFEPFFTTKFTGRGLGLSAVLGIIKAHKGACKLYSEPEKGTTFKALFPASLAADEIDHKKTMAEPREWTGSGTILLVDDENIVLNACKALLEALGYSVLTALNGCDALAIYREHCKEIDLVILDMTMPQMDGAETFNELRRHDPGVRIIIASGYTEQDIAPGLPGKDLPALFISPTRSVNCEMRCTKRLKQVAGTGSKQKRWIACKQQ